MTSSDENVFDVFIIGGGINGVGTARDAAGRGFSVCLCEANDLASGTSSASSKLIHGGLRYLEHYEFRLVREALKEREVLLHMAPHIISPMRFILPHAKHMRSWWLLRLGLFMYDTLGRRKFLPGTRAVNLRTDETGTPLKSDYSTGFEYSDCWVDDARLVVLNAMSAAEKGAHLHVRTRVDKAERKDGLWHITITNTVTKNVNVMKSRVLVNAAGPWVDEVLNRTLGVNSAKNVRLVRGSHIVVPKLFDHDRSYIFQNPDNRIIFAIPYEGDFTLIGTTDVDHTTEPGTAQASDDEVRYLCESVTAYFEKSVTADDVVWRFSGIRPLYDDGASDAQEATRDYVVDTQSKDGTHLINIFGGKITTYRRLSETIVQHIESFLGKRGAAWTESSHLPGGEFEFGERGDLVAQLQASHPFLDVADASRFARTYGTLAKDILGDATAYSDLGQHFGHGLYQAEVEYLVANEWASTAHDIVFRRTKFGILMDQGEVDAIDAFLSSRTVASDTLALQSQYG